MGESGCVSWMFKRKGYFTIEKTAGLPSEDELMALALEAGAEDFKEEDNSYVIITPPEDFETLKEIFQEKNIKFSTAEITMLPETTVLIDNPEEAAKILNLLDALEEHDDVQNVYANFNIPEEILQSLT